MNPAQASSYFKWSHDKIVVSLTGQWQLRAQNAARAGISFYLEPIDARQDLDFCQALASKYRYQLFMLPADSSSPLQAVFTKMPTTVFPSEDSPLDTGNRRADAKETPRKRTIF